LKAANHLIQRTDNPIDRLMCDRPIRIEYDSASCTGKIYMQPRCCTNMAGAIALFTAIDPDVEVIETYAGDAKDTAYRRKRSGWNAFVMGDEV
jgi:hypothetical protein